LKPALASFKVLAFLRHPVFQGISASMHVAFLRHPVFQGISASMHVDVRSVIMFPTIIKYLHPSTSSMWRA